MAYVVLGLVKKMDKLVGFWRNLTESAVFARAKQSTASLVVQVFSMALAVGIGVYGESLWQDRVKRQQTQELVAAIAGEIDRNARYLQHLLQILAFQTRPEYVEQGITDGRRDVLRAAGVFLAEELDRGQSKLLWNSAQYRPEFAAVDIRCIALIDNIYNKYELFLNRVKQELLPPFRDLPSSVNAQNYPSKATELFKATQDIYFQNFMRVNARYFLQFEELIPAANLEQLPGIQRSLKLEACDLRPPSDTTMVVDNPRLYGWAIIYDEDYAPFPGWTPGFAGPKFAAKSDKKSSI